MLVRILSAVFLLPLLLVIFIACPPMYSIFLFALMAAVAAVELLWGTGLVKNIRLNIYSAIAAFVVVLSNAFEIPSVIAIGALFLYMLLLLSEILRDYTQVHFDKLCVCFAAGLILPFMFSSIVRLRQINDGSFYFLIPFLLSFVSDSGAYFVGVFLGKHKLAPRISPKKTIEGFVGGILFTVLGMYIFCFVLQFFFGFTTNYLAAAVYAVVGSLVCVFGDLSFSAIKRQTGIKDYGKLIPGHGGVLDRFDSTIFVAPLVEILVAVWPAMVR